MSKSLSIFGSGLNRPKKKKRKRKKQKKNRKGTKKQNFFALDELLRGSNKAFIAARS